LANITNCQEKDRVGLSLSDFFSVTNAQMQLP